MAALKRIVHFNWQIENPLLYNSMVTIQEAIETQSVDGAIIRTWSDVSGLELLPAAYAPIGAGSPQHQEKRQTDYTSTEVTHHLTLRDYYPAIKDFNRAQVYTQKEDSDLRLDANLDIISVEHDSHNRMTRLSLEILIP